MWPVRRDSNSRRLVSKTSTLPLSYGPICGRGDEIRTHDDDFKDRCLRPLGDTPTNLVEQIGFEPIQQYCPPGYSREPFLSGVYSIIVNTL